MTWSKKHFSVLAWHFKFTNIVLNIYLKLLDYVKESFVGNRMALIGVGQYN